MTSDTIRSIMTMMKQFNGESSIDNLIKQLEEKEKSIKFSLLLSICEELFGAFRVSGSHHIFKTPWQGDPRINLQKDGNMAKPYQVRQVVKCLRKKKNLGWFVPSVAGQVEDLSGPKTFKIMKFEHYLYSVGWSEDDDAFIAKVAEFPSLAAHWSTQEEAWNELREVVKFVLADIKNCNEPIPEPFGKRSYSGRLVLRMPQYLHRKLALEASRQGVSLNQFLNLKLESNI